MQELELFDENPAWRLLLQAYQDRRTTETPWVPRITGVEGLAAAELSAIHGKLIALGLLKFDLGTQIEGIRYQPTSLARQALLPVAERHPLSEWAMEDAA